jgi:DHA3 family macrolide efflux protein-like MFS transporter
MIELLASETSRFAAPGSTFELSKLALAMTLPALLFGPFVGAYVDRVSRKGVLIITDIIRGLTVISIPFMRPSLPLWTVYGAIGVLYLANLFFLPARCAIVCEIVPRDRLIRANSILSLGATLATIAGFAIGGVIAAKAGWRIALFIDAATYFVSAVALAFIRPLATVPGPASSPRASYVETIKQAIQAVARSRIARAGVLIPSVMALAGTTAYVLGVKIIESGIPEGTMYVGFLVGLAGAGMAAGSYFTGKVLHSQSRTTIAAVWTPIAILPLIVIGLTSRLPLVGLAVAAAGFAAGPVFVSTETAIQEQAPDRRQATVFALRDMLMKLAVVVAAAVAAGLANRLGAQTALIALLPLWVVLSLPALASSLSPRGEG